MTDWVKENFNWVWEVSERPDNQKGFVVESKLWLVERTFAWLGKCWRLSKDYEYHEIMSESSVNTETSSASVHSRRLPKPKILKTMFKQVTISAIALFALTLGILIPVQSQPIFPGSQLEERSDTVMPRRFMGVWRGTVEQSSPNARYDVTISLVPTNLGAIAGTINYDAVPCGGELILDRVRGEVIDLSENITYGRRACSNGQRGRIRLRLDSRDSLSYRWAEPSTSLRVNGRLDRISGR